MRDVTTNVGRLKLPFLYRLNYLRDSQVFKCKDGRYFHMHGSLRPSVTLKALDLDPDLPVKSEEEAQGVIAAACARYTAEELRQIYESSGLVGDILLEADEYDASEQVRDDFMLPEI